MKEKKDKIDKYYLNNPRLPSIHTEFQWTAQMLHEIEKCKSNILYFAEKYFTIINLDEGKQVIKLYKAQKRVLKALQEHRFTVVLAARQTGKSTLMTIFALHQICFFSDKKVLIVANKLATAINILKRVKLAFELLPNWIKPAVKSYGAEELAFINDSTIFISTTTSTAARGESVSTVILDECVIGETLVTIKNKNTGEIKKVKMEEIYNSEEFN